MAYQSKYTGLQIDDILDSVEWKQGKIEDLASIREGAAKGATALQSYTEKYTGTVTGIKINGETKSGSGIIDLGTISTDISGKQDKLVDGVNIATINGQSLTTGGDLTIESGAKVYEWFYDGESESVTLSQEEYDNIVEADLVIVNAGGIISFAVSKTSKEFSEEIGYCGLNGQLDMQGSKMFFNMAINISTKLATITLEQQEIPTKTSELENDKGYLTEHQDISHLATKDELAQKQDVISDIDTIRTNAANYKGTVTSVKVDNFIKTQSGGVVDLGYVNKKLTTSASSSMTLSPNIYYRNTSTSLSTLTITLGSVSNSNIINEYFVEFTTRSAGTTVSLPSTIKWANGETPTFEASTTYQISIVNNLGVVTKFK